MRIHSWFLSLLLVATLSTAIWAQQGESPLPALPPDIPKEATMWMLLFDGKPVRQNAVWMTPDGAVHEFFQFNDRGRGPKTYSTYRFDGRGIVTSEETQGNDYMKNPVNETFTLTGSDAKWKNTSEVGKNASAAGRFYVGLNSGPAGTYLLAQALLNRSRFTAR